MPTATVTSKGQITVPLAVRTALGLHAGTRLDFVAEGDGFKLVPLRKASPALKGRFKGRALNPVSTEAMDAAVADEAASSNQPIAR